MNKELFLKAVLQAADRIVARSLENGPADIYDIQLVGTSTINDDTTLKTVTHGETLTKEVSGAWRLDSQYRKEALTHEP